jgi:hypothetical protein
MFGWDGAVVGSLLRADASSVARAGSAFPAQAAMKGVPATTRAPALPAAAFRNCRRPQSRLLFVCAQYLSPNRTFDRRGKLGDVSRRRRLLGIAVSLGAFVFGQATTAHADSFEATADDVENGLWDCPARRVAFGDAAVDVLRCLTFRFDAPDNVSDAVLYLDIDAPSNSLQDTDSLVVAVAQPFDECAWAQGTMEGCVIVHGGFAGGEKSLVVDLLDLTCDPTVGSTIDASRQGAVRDQIQTGVIHVMLQDDTAVLGAWLDIDGRPAPACGTSTDIVPVNVVSDARTAGSSSGSSSGGRPGTSAVTTIAAVAGIVVLGAGAAVGTTSVRRARARRVRPDVRVDRRVDEGRIEMDESGEHRSVAIGVRTWPDDDGTQLYEEAR